MLSSIIQKFSKEKYTLLAVFSIGLLLRLAGSLLVYLVFDESAWVEVANRVSFSPKNFHLVYHGDHHPYFEVYLIKFSSLLFNKYLFSVLPSEIATRLSLRLLHVLLCSATIVIVYYLAKYGLGKRSATFAALVMAFSQFHIHFSRTIIQIGSLLFFVSLSLLLFWRAVEQNKHKFIVFTGISVGMAYLCEESASLLLVIFFIFLLITKRLVQWLKKWQTYAALLAFLVLISPDVYWNLTAPNPDMKLHLIKAAKFQGISLLSTSLYIGELFLLLAQDVVSFVGGLGRNAAWPVEYPPMHWVLGILCFAAVIYSFNKRKHEFIKLMQTAFLFIFLFFTLFASSGLFKNFNFYWASISFIPAVVLVSNLFADFFGKKSFLKWLPVAFVLYFFCHSVYFLSITDQIYVRRSSFLKEYYINLGREGLLKGNISWARKNFKKALKQDSKSETAWVNLAECYRRMGQHDKAESILEEGRERGFLPQEVNRFLLDRGYIKAWLIAGCYKASEWGTDEIRFLSWKELIRKIKITKAQKFEKIESPSAFIDLRNLLESPPHTYSYALTQIYSPKERNIKFLVGADDGLAVWLNREKVYENKEKHIYFADEDTVSVHLNQGWNDLVVKVLYLGGIGYGFTLRITDEAGEAIENIQTRALLSF
ncbi:MAG: glycosyltransferase family 39 protein [Candidatus Aminicenantes bacterium]